MADNQALIISRDSTSSSFRFLKTWKVAVFQAIALVIYGIVILVISIKEIWLLKKCDVLFLTFYFQAGLWMLFLIIDHYYKWQHHILYIKGYFEFHKTLSKCSSLLFAGISLFNAICMLFGGTLFFKCKTVNSICESNELFASTVAINIIIDIEIIALVSLLLYYSGKVVKFNKQQPVADIRRVSFWIPENSASVLEIGYRDKEEDLADLLQKQADLIQYYKGKVVFLNEKIMKLSHSTVEC